MTAPARARVWWKDRTRRTTIVHLTAHHWHSPFTGRDMIFLFYADMNGAHIGPGFQPTHELAWESLQWWAAKEEAGATAFPPPSDEEPAPALVDDDEGNPAELRNGL